jgi:hypothetical protein
MTTKTQQAREEELARRHHEDENEVRHCLDQVLREQVLHGLGHPPDLLAVHIRPLWPGHYRVNVFVGADLASARVGHSYFLVVSDDGNILASTPEITRRY